MSKYNQIIKDLALKCLHISHGRPLNTPISGLGSILCFHRVKDEKISKFNSILEISTKKFENILQFLSKEDYTFVSLNQISEILLNESTPEKKFIAITFDDGYQDNYSIAYPILEKYNIPFAIYITTDFPDKKCIIWWYMLEDIILENKQISFKYQGKRYNYNCQGLKSKQKVFTEIRSFILETDSTALVEKLKSIFDPYNKEINPYTEKLAISWDEIIQLSRDPLVTIAAHTVSHQALSKLSEINLKSEIQESIKILESKIHKKVEHFAYPFGSRSEFGNREIEMVKNLNLETAVTTLPGNIFKIHKDYLHALPRVFMSESINQFALNVRLNGIYQYLTNNLKKTDLCI